MKSKGILCSVPLLRDVCWNTRRGWQVVFALPTSPRSVSQRGSLRWCFCPLVFFVSFHWQVSLRRGGYTLWFIVTMLTRHCRTRRGRQTKVCLSVRSQGVPDSQVRRLDYLVEDGRWDLRRPAHLDHKRLHTLHDAYHAEVMSCVPRYHGRGSLGVSCQRQADRHDPLNHETKNASARGARIVNTKYTLRLKDVLSHVRVVGRVLTSARLVTHAGCACLMSGRPLLALRFWLGDRSPATWCSVGLVLACWPQLRSWPMQGHLCVFLLGASTVSWHV